MQPLFPCRLSVGRSSRVPPYSALWGGPVPSSSSGRVENTAEKVVVAFNDSKQVWVETRGALSSRWIALQDDPHCLPMRKGGFVGTVFSKRIVHVTEVDDSSLAQNSITA